MSNQNKNHKIAIIITTKLYKELEWTLVEPNWTFDGEMLHEEEKGVRAFLQYRDLDSYSVYAVPCTNFFTADKETRGQFLEELIDVVIRHGKYESQNVYLFAHDKDFCPTDVKDELAEEGIVSETINLKNKLTQLIEEKHVWMFYHEKSSKVGSIIAGIGKTIGKEECKKMIDIIDENREMIDYFNSVNQDDRYGQTKKGGENHE